MSGNVGYATLTILPSARGFGKSLGEQVNPPLEQAGKSGGASLVKTIGSTFTDLGKTVLATAGATAAGALATALTKGLGRLEAIDTAKAKLTGLGKTTEEIASIMDSATAAVRGTAFGLGDAASAAAQFSAGGVPLDGMQRTLTILASASAVAGSSMGDMTTIFGKVAATGKVSGEVVQQLSERGIPVLSLLSQHFGTTAEEVSKMVSAGKVGFEDFQTALETALGPAAQAMGNSFSGMVSNVGAALGRLGAALLSPGFEASKSVMPGLMNAIDQLKPLAEALANAIAEKLAPGIEKVVEWLNALDFSGAVGGIDGFVAALGPLLPLLLGAVGMLGPLASGLPIIGPLFSGVTGPVGLLAGALIALLAIDPTTLLDGFNRIAAALPGMIQGLTSALVEFIPKTVAALGSNIPVFAQGIVQVIDAAVPALASAVPQLVTAIVGVIPLVLSALLGAVPTLLNAALTLFQSLVTAVVQVAPLVVQQLVGLIPILATNLINALPAIIQAALSLFSGLAQGLVEAIPLVITALLEAFPTIVETLVGMLPDLIHGAVTLFTGLVTGLLEILPDLIRSLVVDVIPSLISTLIGLTPQLLRAAVTVFFAIVEALLTQIGPLAIAITTELVPAAIGALVGAIPDLLQAGMDMIRGLVDGFIRAADQVRKTLLQIIERAVGAVLSFLGIHSPSRLFRGYGQNTGEGYALGLEDSADDIQAAMLSIAPEPFDLPDPFAGAGGPGAGPAAAGATYVDFSYTQIGGAGLTAEQEVRRAATRLSQSIR